MKTEKVVFCRIGWGKYYGLDGNTETLIGGGEWNKDNIGSEVHNFWKHKGKFYGYVQSPSKGEPGKFNFQRVLKNGNNESGELKNVLVIFYSINPYRGKSRILGWYKNATIYDSYEERSFDETNYFNMEAKVEDCVLLPIENRKFIVPRKGKGSDQGTGQSNIYYTLDEDGDSKPESWIKEAIEYINGYNGRNLLNEDLNKLPINSSTEIETNEKAYSYSGDYTEIEAFDNRKFLKAEEKEKIQSRYKPIVFFKKDINSYLKIDQKKDNVSFLELFNSVLNLNELKEIKLVSYVMSNSFFEELKIFNTCKSKNIEIKILVAPPEGISHNFALKLKSLDESNSLYKIKQIRKNVYSPNLMHSKLSIFIFGNNCISIIGSSNLTLRGLKYNTEINTALLDSINSSYANNYFDELWNNESEELNPAEFNAVDNSDLSVTPSPILKRELFKYQKEAISKLEKRVNHFLDKSPKIGGHGGGFLVLPLGAGKTITALRWIFENLFKKRKAKVLWLAHRRELLDQAYETGFQENSYLQTKIELNDSFRYISSVQGDYFLEGDFLFLTTGLAFSRFDSLKEVKFDLIVCDEAHRASELTLQYGEILKKLKYSFVLGLTATPYRGDIQNTNALANIFNLDRSEKNKSLPDLIYECDYKRIKELEPDKKIFSKRETLPPIETGIKKRIGENNFEFSLDEFDTPKRNKLIVEKYFELKQKYKIKSSIIFCISCEHANKIAELINEKSEGEAQAFHNGEIREEASILDLENGNSIAPIRQDIIIEFRKGKIPCLTSVLLLTEGFDVPKVDAIFLARPTYSTLLLMQMIGRGIRGIDIGGTEICYIVDFIDQTDHHQKRHETIMKISRMTETFDNIEIKENEIEIYDRLISRENSI
jgi:superfamily II DNA or RNA helicase